MAPVLWTVNRRFRIEAQPAHAGLAGELQPGDGHAGRVGQRDPRDPGLRAAGHERRAVPLLLADHSRYNVALARTSAMLLPILELNSQFFVAVLLLLGGWRAFHD